MWVACWGRYWQKRMRGWHVWGSPLFEVASCTQVVAVGSFLWGWAAVSGLVAQRHGDQDWTCTTDTMLLYRCIIRGTVAAMADEEGRQGWVSGSAVAPCRCQYVGLSMLFVQPGGATSLTIWLSTTAYKHTQHPCRGFLFSVGRACARPVPRHAPAALCGPACYMTHFLVI
jgi:hypothetical protein